MKAFVISEYGPPDVLTLQEVRDPIPGPKEILIRNRATAVTTGDVNIRGAVFIPPGLTFLQRLMFGLGKPKREIIGMVLAGEVVALGPKVSKYSVGDRVFGITGAELGAYAEFACQSEDAQLARIPAGFSFTEMVAVPFGAATALYFLRDLGEVQEGAQVLVNGASGGVGVYAVQIAKYYGAEVTGVCSTKKGDLVQSLGADHVVDYTKTDFTTLDRTFDLIVDTVVGDTSFARVKNALKPKGRYLPVAGGLREMIQSQFNAFRGGKKIMAGAAPDRAEDLVFLRELLEAGHIKSVIDKRFPFQEMVAAHRYVDEGHKTGAVVVFMTEEEEKPDAD